MHQRVMGLFLLAVVCSACGPRDAPQATDDGSPASSTAAPASETSVPTTASTGSAPAPGAIAVTPDNFVRAESDLYMANLAKESGGLGKLLHRREPASIEHQTVIRLNRDTLYSSAVFDLDAGPVTVTLPDAGDRFQSLMFVNQDHYAWTEYGAGPHEVTRDKAGTRYVLVGIRTLVDPANAQDVEAVHRLQDAIAIKQDGGPGTLDLPQWEPVSQKKVRDALLALGSTIPDFSHAFGSKEQVDPVRHLIGTASGWGGNPDRDAKYLNVTPPQNDGRTVYRLRVKDVPVDAFWSVSVYNADGYYVKNDYDAYAINSVTAKKEADGTALIQFGGCDGKIPNCIPVMPGWNYTVRLYRPQKAILDGTWKFPEPQPVQS